MPRIPRVGLARLLISLAIFAVLLSNVRREALRMPARGAVPSLPIMIDVPAPRDKDGRQCRLTEPQWEALRENLTSTAVLKTALADPRLSSLPEIRTATDPIGALRARIYLTLPFNEKLREDAVLTVASLSCKAKSSREEIMVTDVVSAAMTAMGPPGTWIRGRPMSMHDGRTQWRGSLADCPLEVYWAVLVSLVISFGWWFVPVGAILRRLISSETMKRLTRLDR
jgi:hypothetical protein